MIKENIYYSFIYKNTISKTIYAVKHQYGESGVNDFFDWLNENKEVELITSVENSGGHFEELEEIVVEASKREIDEIQLKSLVEFVRRKIRPLNSSKR